MHPGSHLAVRRGVYSHHGILVENKKVIHFASPPERGTEDFNFRQLLGADSQVNRVHETTLERFRADDEVSVVEYERDHVYPPLKVVARAKSRLGEDGYNLWGNNCEHLCRWCMVGKHESLQVNAFKSVLHRLAIGSRGDGPVKGAIGPGIRNWFGRKKPLRPVYQQFVEYATALYFDTSRERPLGGSFVHAGQVEEGRGRPIPLDMGEQALFCYSGSLWTGTKKDWVVTERAMVWPERQICVNFHDVADIASSFHHIVVTDLDGLTYSFSCRYAHARSVAKFLTAAVACTPLEKGDMRRNLRSRFKDFLQSILGWFTAPEWRVKNE